MWGISDAHHFRKMVAGFCMVFAPLCLVVGFVAAADRLLLEYPNKLGYYLRRLGF